jgi:hypothetical protein
LQAIESGVKLIYQGIGEKIMSPHLNYIVEKFPALSEQILTLYERNDEFKSLCYDYFICLKSLENWRLNLKKDETLINEYSDLQRTLESEVLGFIEKNEQQQKLK